MVSRYPSSRAAQLIAAATLLATVAGCEQEKSRNPLSASVAGPIPGVSITAPRPLEPGQGSEIKAGTAVTLLIENAASTGERPTWIQLEVALDAEFASKVHAVDKLTPGPNGRTSYALPITLEGGRTYYWRSRALDGANTGPFSAAAMFRVVVPLRIEAPVPVSPIGGTTIPNNRPELVAQSTAITGTPAGTVYYRFEISDSASFARTLAVWTVPRGTGATTSAAGGELPLGAEYFWRASASDGAYTSGYSAVVSFRTAAPPPPPPPPPTPEPAPSPTPAPTPAPAPAPAPPPAPTPPSGGGGTVGPNRRISPNEVLQIVRGYHDAIGANLGSSSTREGRVDFLWQAMAAVHYGHPRWNPAGGDPNWCVKDAGGGRPPSDDVITICSSRESWDIIGGAGANGYSWHLDHIGVLPGGQNVYPPPRSSLPR